MHEAGRECETKTLPTQPAERASLNEVLTIHLVRMIRRWLHTATYELRVKDRIREFDENGWEIDTKPN